MVGFVKFFWNIGKVDYMAKVVVFVMVVYLCECL